MRRAARRLGGRLGPPAPPLRAVSDLANTAMTGNGEEKGPMLHRSAGLVSMT